MPARRKTLKKGRGFAAAGSLRTALAARSALSPERAAQIDPMQFVNPEFRSPLEAMIKDTLPDLRPISTSSLPLLRQSMVQLRRPALPEPRITERLIPGPNGEPKVRVYMVGNKRGAARPAVLHIHGGGYIAGSPVRNLRDIQELSTALDCVVVSVDYRLAPETHFPGSLEDNYAALRWMHLHARELGIDRKRIAIKGESAGGGHAAALAIAARDRGEVPVSMQVLIYPMLDDRTGSTRKVPPFIGHYVWTAADNRFGWTSLLGVPAGSAKVPRYSVPARVKDLRGLPPAFIGVGCLDLFVSEDMAYAQRLINSGVSTQLSVVPGAFHGFDTIAPNARLSRLFARTWREALRLAFGGKPATRSANLRS